MQFLRAEAGRFQERGDAFHLSQADQLGFGSLGFLRRKVPISNRIAVCELAPLRFGICSRSGSKDRVKAPNREYVPLTFVLQLGRMPANTSRTVLFGVLSEGLRLRLGTVIHCDV